MEHLIYEDDLTNSLDLQATHSSNIVKNKICCDCKKPNSTFISKTPTMEAPLCAQCLPSHLEKHKKLNIIPEISLLTDEADSSNKQALLEKKKDIQKMIDHVSGLDCSMSIEEIRKSKEQLLESVNYFFFMLEEETKSKFDDMKISCLNILEKDLSKCEQLDKEGSQEADLDSIVSVNPESIQSIQGLVQVTTNKDAIGSICAELSKYVQVTHHDIELYDDQPSLDDLLKVSIQNSDNIFLSQPFVHYFKGDSNMLYLLNLSETPLKMQERQLEIDFKIPLKHSSICLPTGQVMLLGGADPEYKARKSNRSYCYDISKSNALQRKGNLVHARIGGEAVYFQGFIYLLGGKVTKGGFTTTCEKYNPKTDKWTEVGSLLSASYQPSVCNFRDKLIYKFGGKAKKGVLNDQIEKYVPANDKWYMVAYKSNCTGDERVAKMQIGCGGRAVQISQDEMFIFGGHSVNSSSEKFESFVLRYELQTITQSKWEQKTRGREVVTQLGSINPSMASNLISELVLYKRKLYCLSTSGVKGELLLLKFDGKKWSSQALLL